MSNKNKSKELSIKILNSANKDKYVFQISDGRVLVIDKIKQPEFYIGGVVLDELDVRNIMVQVSKGDIDYKLLNEIGITDENGQKLMFREDGLLVNSPAGLNKSSKMALELFKTKNEK